MDGLAETRQRLIENLSRMSDFWGYPRAMGALYGALYLSPAPLSLDDLIPIVGVTKGAVSTNVRALEQLGMVHRHIRPGDRKDYYEADTDFWKISKAILERRQKPEFDKALKGVSVALESVRSRPHSRPEAELAKERLALEGIRAFVREVVAQIKAAMPKVLEGAAKGAGAIPSGPVAGPCPRCGADLRLRSWEGRHYVKCSAAGSDPDCRVAYDSDAEGKPLDTCRMCRGPVRTTKAGGKVCVLCGRWVSDQDGDLPEPGVCATCGKPMRLVPSTARGKYFRRCVPCGVLRPVE